MPEPQTFTLDLENKGLLISRPGDVLPAGFLPNLKNMTADKSGFIQSRSGTARVSSTNLGLVHSQGRIIVQGTAYAYQGAGTALYRNWTQQIATGFSGNPLILRDGGPDISTLPYEIAWDSMKRVKDDGTATTNFGIAGPMAMASAVPVAATTKTIDLFEYATDGAIQAAWPGPTGPTIITNSVNPFQGTYNGKIESIGGALIYVTRTVSLDLSQFTTPGDSTDEDYIVIAVRSAQANKTLDMRLQFDVDPSVNDFTKNYYTAQIVSDVVALTDNVWGQIFVRKADFLRTGNDANDWANVKAVRIVVQLNEGGIFTPFYTEVDDLIMQKGGNLNGTDYEWIYRYRNNNTGTTSPFSPVMQAQVAIDHSSATVTVRNPRDTQATHIELYRKGGATSVFSFVTEKVVTSWTGTTTFADTIPDADQGDVPDLTQVELANLEQTPSQTCTSAQKTTNSGAAYTDYTSAVSDDNGATYADLSTLPNVAGGGWLLIGADQLFRQILIVMDSSVNTNTSVLTVQYWNGSAWYNAPNPIDGTDVLGVTFAAGGTIEFDLPNDWALSTANSIDAYYVRLSVSATLSASVHVTEVRVGANAFDPETCEVFNGRLWSNDARHTDRVWYSERFTPEIFLANNYVVRSRSGDPIVRPFGLDDQLFVFTQQTVDRLIGSAPDSFQLIPTGSEVGLFSTNAVCRGRGRLFYRAPGGIYALPGSGFSDKISLPMQPLFDGFTSPDGAMQPISVFERGTEVMEYSASKLWFGYTDADAIRQEFTYDLDLDRWEPTDRPVTSYLRLDDLGQLYSGSNDGYVYLRNNGNTDQGSAIAISFSTPYIDFGGQSVDKQITEIAIDCDLQGQTLAFFAGFNNGQAPSQTVNLTNSARGIVYFPMSDDTQARNVALGVVSNNGGQNVKFYKVTFFFIPLRSPVTKLPTEWDNMGYPGDKRLRQLQIEIDTQGVSASVEVQVDGVTTETLTVNTPSRQIVPTSLTADTIGKLTRLIITSSTPFRYYGHVFEFLSDPLQMTRYDTIELDFGYTRWKSIRRLWIAAQTPTTITVAIWIDQVLRFTSQAILIQSASGWIKYDLVLPPGLKGMVFRFVITSTVGFKVFLNQSDVEWKPLASDRGYARAPLASQEFLPPTRQQ